MAEPIRKIYGGAVLKQDGTLNDREIRVVASDATVDRTGDVMVPSGCRLDGFAKNPIVLANHNPDNPIGTAQATIKDNRVEALITFAPPGLSNLADEWCGLAKAKIVNAVSIGFTPIQTEPIRGGGTRYLEWELLELSFVSVPANPNAVVVARSARATTAAPQRPKPDPAIVARNRREYEARQACRAEGLAELTPAEWNKFLALEYPGVSDYEARAAYRARMDFFTSHEHFMERVRRSDFAKKERAEAAPSFKWEPHRTTAQNTFELRRFELQGGRWRP